MAVSREMGDINSSRSESRSLGFILQPSLSTISAIAIRAHRNLQVTLSSENEINYLKFLVL
jgi:hypothetical protein